MALDVFFRSDLEHMAIGLLVSSLSAVRNQGGIDKVYCQGMIDMMRGQVLLYGGDWKIVSLKTLEELRSTIPQKMIDEIQPLLIMS